MDQWNGKIAIVTGASSGIGKSICVTLLQHGVHVVGLARRLENMKKIAEQVKDTKGTFYPVVCDLRKEKDILEAFKFVEKLGGAAILVNNAGLSFKEPISDSSTDNLKTVLDINILAVAICARETIKSLKKRKARGHVININSVLGHNAMLNNAPVNLYEVTKYGITAMSEVLRREMQQSSSLIKVTSLSPGLVKTEMPVLQEIGGEEMFKATPHLQSEDIANGVVYVLSTPPNVQVEELTIAALN